MYLILKKTLICWKTEFTIVYGKIEMQKKGSKNTQQGRSFYAQTEPPHVNLVLTGLCTFSSPFMHFLLDKHSGQFLKIFYSALAWRLNLMIS